MSLPPRPVGPLRVVIDTDYPDYDRLAYTASYRAEMTERIEDAPPEEHHGGGQHC